MASKGKHTPGPWKAEGPVRDSHTGVPAIEIGAETPKGHLSVAWVFGLHADEDPDAAWADARLIALAPQLVEALRELVERRDRACREAGRLDRLDGTDGRYARARALLARVSP